ncbi:uncharacterized protein LOC134198529 [Corticium candelabrum]|uniref:uncharacterized protein LOC134198529 n=1 Tax=Corticium candelabrum TaxID=121492 RepID=UPI002E27548F|nr:uncharacterized protein LOC134198529 [Corticium candelabrum]
MRKILGKEEWNKQHTEWLLMKVLPKTDNLGYFKFCCLLRVKFNLGEIGNRFCKGCDNFSLENCTIHDKSVLFVDSSSCQPLLQHSIMEHMSKHTYVSVNYSSNLEREFVFNSSIVCLDNKIFVDLIFNIDERYIDKEILGRQFVIRTFSDNSDVELHVYDKVDGINRTSMLLSMSAVAGMQLLSVMGEETSKDEFGTMLISLALSSKVGRKVFIQLTLSDMPPESPFVMNVMPKAKFSIKSDRDDNYYFINEFDLMSIIHFLFEDIQDIWWVTAAVTVATTSILLRILEGCYTFGLDVLNDSNTGNDRDIGIPSHKVFQRKDLIYDSRHDLIGRGGFADVYKAVLQRKTTVAFKKPFIGGSRFKNVEMENIMEESSILLDIPTHKHIVKIIGICIDARHFGIVLEYIDGGDLSRLLSSHTIDSYMDDWKNKLDMTCQIADGMKHLHGLDQPVIHRDLKPNNILVKKSSAKYTCKISDFGMAKLRATTTTGYTGDGSSLHAAGSLGYVAPERYGSVRLDMPALAKSDIYSFGVILFQFRERILPFGEENNPLVIALNAREGTPFKVPVKPSPHGYDELMRSCCSMQRDDRPAFSDILINLQAMSHNTNA